MGWVDLLRPRKLGSRLTRWKELGAYSARFAPFGKDVYQSEIVRSCVRALAEFTAKAEARCADPTIQRMLNDRPNLYMSGHDFLYKVRTQLELRNTAFVAIMRDDRGRTTGLYPIPCASYEAVEFQDRLFVKFSFSGEAAHELAFAWEDLAVLRKDYLNSDIAGDDNGAILRLLETLDTVNQGVANAVKSTANLRGILKSTKGMLTPEAIKRQKDQFVADYMTLENEGGIASLDATQEFEPLDMKPIVAGAETLAELRENVCRYFGVSDRILSGAADSDEIEAFYELRVEPFLVALSRELTGKIFTPRERAYGNWIAYEANKLQFASLSKKIQLYKEVVLYGGMTVNEWRAGCNLAPIEGGDERVMRLDAGAVSHGRKRDDGGNDDGEPDEP